MQRWLLASFHIGFRISFIGTYTNVTINEGKSMTIISTILLKIFWKTLISTDRLLARKSKKSAIEAIAREKSNLRIKWVVEIFQKKNNIKIDPKNLIFKKQYRHAISTYGDRKRQTEETMHHQRKRYWMGLVLIDCIRWIVWHDFNSPQDVIFCWSTCNLAQWCNNDCGYERSNGH